MWNTVWPALAPVFIQPRVLPVPLATLDIGTAAPVITVDGGWLLIRFKDERWGERVGYVSCADATPEDRSIH